MSSIFGSKIQCSIFGESHGPAIGVTIHGLPAGESVDMQKVQAFLQRRAPGNNPWSSQRKEPDAPEVVSGLYRAKTTGAPLTVLIKNTDAREQDYENTKVIPRPGHADLTAYLRYDGFNDKRGGGHLSGRLTAPLCIAGAIASQILARHGIFIGAHIAEIASIKDLSFDPVNLPKTKLLAPGKKEFPVIDDAAGTKMQQAILNAHSAGDSVGGIIECAASGMPAGCGSPMFGRVENKISSIIFGIPAVRGLEFGDGFLAARLRGSENNDAFLPDGTMATNHSGGMLGGITTGMPIILRVAVKPTPSIQIPQPSFDITTRLPVDSAAVGRHDPCIVPRAVPVVEAAVAVALLELLEE